MRFALAGADVWIIGRGEQKAKSVLDQLRLASAEAHRRNGKTNASSDHQFFQADLRRVEDIERVANDIKKRAGSKGIDYLVETQGGPPNGRIEPPASSRSPEPSFAVQVASRFGLAYLLTADKTIKKGESRSVEREVYSTLTCFLPPLLRSHLHGRRTGERWIQAPRRR